ncbi:hypothetical protein LIER_07146 [Lithospermum erythrorhizon]|uniref:HAT C-terminal dimerisation domain-containing protein n=1 Tax=Lithospermum erythrorhizon TaxID=34254 RepID=A0AAV3PBF6_LITER
MPDMKPRYVKDSRSERNDPFITYLHYFKHDYFIHVIHVILKELNELFTHESTELLQCVVCLSPCSSFEAFDTKSLVMMARLYLNNFVGIEDEEWLAQLERPLRSLEDSGTNKETQDLQICVEACKDLPISTASVERVFSGMNYVEDDLRSKMGNVWLNDYLVTYVEKEVFSAFDNRDIINRFQAMKERRMTIKL